MVLLVSLASRFLSGPLENDVARVVLLAGIRRR